MSVCVNRVFLFNHGIQILHLSRCLKFHYHKAQAEYKELSVQERLGEGVQGELLPHPCAGQQLSRALLARSLQEDVAMMVPKTRGVS